MKLRYTPQAIVDLQEIDDYNRSGHGNYAMVLL